MTAQQHQTATNEMSSEVKQMISGYFGPFINPRITESLEILLEYLESSYEVIFKDGKVMKLSIFNIISWWKFLKLSYSFITKLVSIWK